jgi:hypothetical protein
LPPQGAAKPKTRFRGFQQQLVTLLALSLVVEVVGVFLVVVPSSWPVAGVFLVRWWSAVRNAFVMLRCS